MKFGRQFELYKIPEWFEYYFDYRGIKLILKFLDNRPSKKKKLKALQMIKKNYIRKYSLEPSDKILRRTMGVNQYALAVNNHQQSKKYRRKIQKIFETEDLSLLPNNLKVTRFIGIYKEKVKVIDDFFKMKLDEYNTELRKLEIKMNSISHPIEGKEEEPNEEIDEMGYAVSWKRALSNLYNETSWLHGFHSINQLAIAKIKKKAVKVFNLHKVDISKNLEEVESQFLFFSKYIEDLVELRVNINNIYSNQFTDGDHLKGKKELEKGLQGQVVSSQYQWLCLYLGIFCSCIFFYVIIKCIDGNNKNDSFKPFFPFFSFSYIIILTLYLLGIVMYLLKYYRINYKYIFELDTRNKICPLSIFQNATLLSALWIFLFLMMKLSLKFDLFGGEYTLFPLIMNTLLVVIFFLPFHILYLSFRRGLIITLIRNLFPFGESQVRFKDFIFGDVLTSLSDSFKNLILGYCLMTCRGCMLGNQRSPCSKTSIPCFIISIYPQFIRFTQCINKFYYTRLLWPHFGNILKYIIALSNIFSGYFYDRSKTHIRMYFRIFLGAAATAVNLFWDIYLDWGCARRNNKHIFLREKLTYPVILYYFAIIYDIIVRTTWTWNFIHIKDSLSEWKNILTCTLEITRRALWGLIRVENENLSNPENYRTIFAIPDLPVD